MFSRGVTLIFGLVLLFFFSASVEAQEDMTSSADHPKIPRIQGTVIRGYSSADYDEGEFITGVTNKKLETITVGGKRTRILYMAPKNTNGAMAWKNYGVAFEGLGVADHIYNCTEENCPSKLGRTFIWSKNRRIPTNIDGSDFLYAPIGYRNQRYAYATFTKEGARYHVSLFYAWLTGIQAPEVRDVPVIHLEIVEEADFKAALQVVTPDEITESINEKGRVAIYGIYFDFDSDVLKPGSAAAIEAIAAALNNNPDLKTYVVGHTDNQGSYEYNLNLSNRRAAAVVKALISTHGIPSERLLAAGVGPVAPVSTNRTEKGQALNRRVELVEF